MKFGYVLRLVCLSSRFRLRGRKRILYNWGWGVVFGIGILFLIVESKIIVR